MTSVASQIPFGATKNRHVVVLENKPAVGLAVAELIIHRAAEAVKDHGFFTLGLSGGSLAPIVCPRLLELSETRQVDMSAWHIFWVDERCVPLDHADSNYKAANAVFLSKAKGLLKQNVHAIDPDLVKDPAKAAHAYDQAIRKVYGVKDSESAFPAFDLLLLGMGPDGHTCSLFPNHPLLEEDKLWVAPITDSPKLPSNRITFTLPLVNKANCVGFVAAGASKQDMLVTVLETPASKRALPSQLATGSGALFWFLDEAASGKLKSETLTVRLLPTAKM